MLSVGFDFDHTLGIDNKLERRIALEMLGELAAAERVSLDPAQTEAAIDEALREYRSGELPVETAIAAFFARFVPLNDRAKELTDVFRERALERAPEFVQPLPGLHEMLAGLEALGIRYAILSNGWSPLQEEKARLVGFEGPVFVSERIGALKPAPKAFEVLVNHF